MVRSPMLVPACVLAGSIVLGAGMLSHAGPLDPPAGPVAPSYKTLTEVEPRIAINATNTPGDAASVFKITQPGSYYLTGPVVGVSGKSGILVGGSNVTIDLNGFRLEGVPGSQDGVLFTGGSRNTVRNGSVVGWGGSGINMTNSSGSAAEQLKVLSNASNGISLGGGSIVRACESDGNGGHGHAVSLNSVIESCEASGNTGSGIDTSQSVVRNCAVNNNAIGINAGAASDVSDCDAQVNKGDGIRVNSYSRVTENTCAFNGNGSGDGANIHATGSDNRVEANNVIGADRGIDVDSAGNLIIRNSASGNTLNFDVVSGNFGQYLSATSSGAVSGATGGTALGSTDPWVNWSY